MFQRRHLFCEEHNVFDTFRRVKKNSSNLRLNLIFSSEKRKKNAYLKYEVIRCRHSHKTLEFGSLNTQIFYCKLIVEFYIHGSVNLY